MFFITALSVTRLAFTDHFYTMKDVLPLVQLDCMATPPLIHVSHVILLAKLALVQTLGNVMYVVGHSY
jgi:hypothetical protein